MSDTYLLPASLTQRRLWLLDQLGPGAATYNIAWLVSLDGPLDVAALEAALTRLVARHESLRTHFTAVDGEPAQVVEPAGPVRLHPVDAGEDWRRHVDEAARRPFDLAAGPLTRFTLLRRPDGSHALVWVVHHAVADGWSFGVLFGELTAAYAGEALPDAPMQYGDFAIWQREQARLGAFDDDLTYWHRALTGAPVLLDLPADRPRPAEQDDAGGTVTREVPPELTARLRQGPAPCSPRCWPASRRCCTGSPARTTCSSRCRSRRGPGRGPAMSSVSSPTRWRCARCSRRA